MNGKSALFKFGGKILENETNLENCMSQLKSLYDSKILDKIIIVPGGGTVANFIRSLDSKFKLGEERSHWMAIYSMNFNGRMLAKKYENIEIMDSTEQFKNKKRLFAIFLPYEYIRNNDLLPHNWQVTSDSIALMIAKNLGIFNIFLVKNIDGIMLKDNICMKELTTEEFKNKKKLNYLKKMGNDSFVEKKSTPIDNYLPDLIDKYRIPCIIINGAKPARIYNYFMKKGEVCKTRLFPTDLE